MNYNKHIKPKLLEPNISKKIIKTLNPPKEDYWEPTKNMLTNFYHNYIWPNIYIIIAIIIVIIILIYRYRVIKKEREQESQKMQENLNPQILMQTYNLQKEEAREPQITKITKNNFPKFAYPMYPYAKGGKLLPPSKR